LDPDLATVIRETLEDARAADRLGGTTGASRGSRVRGAQKGGWIRLPSVSERLPEVSFVDTMDRPWESVGKYGGSQRLLIWKKLRPWANTVHGSAL
jgi:hypothetical protein